MTIAVITPIYATAENKRLGFLGSTIKSVIKQDYGSVVHLVVDDGSTADVGLFLKDYPHVRYARREKKTNELNTASNPLNLGIELCTKGSPDVFAQKEAETLDAVTYLHSDDILTPSSISARMASFKDSFVYSDSAIFDEQRKVTEIKSHRRMSREQLPCLTELMEMSHHTFLWNITFLRKLQEYISRTYQRDTIFNGDLYFGEDADATMCSFEAALPAHEPSYVDRVTALNRFHRNSITGEALSNGGSPREQLDLFLGVHFGITYAQFLDMKYGYPSLTRKFLRMFPEPVKKLLRPIQERIILEQFRRNNAETISQLENIIAQT